METGSIASATDPVSFIEERSAIHLNVILDHVGDKSDERFLLFTFLLNTVLQVLAGNPHVV